MRWVPALLLAACAATSPRETPPAASIRFEGAADLDEDALRKAAEYELEQYGLRGRRPADLADAAYKMSRVLHAGGFPHATVQFRVEDGGLVFAVSPGPRGYLGEVTFAGAETVSENDLRAVFLSAQTAKNEGRPVFVRADIDSGLTDVLALYRDRGHYRARIGPVKVRWSADRVSADVHIPVHEGGRYRIRSFRVEGELPADARASRDDLSTDGYFRAVLPYQAAARIRGRLLNAGYRGAVVRPHVAVDDDAAAVDIVIHVEAGAPYRLHEVIVTGQDRTRERFVRTRIATGPGEVVRESDLEKAREALYATNLFRRVRITTGALDEKGADLEVEIEEYLSRSVSAKVGWESYELLSGALTYEDLNFTGRGQVLTLEVNGSTKGYGAGGAFRDAYVLGPRWDIVLRGGYEFREEPTFDRTAVRGSITFTHELARWERKWPARPRALDVSIGYLYDAERADNLTGPIDPAEHTDFAVSAGLIGSLDYDSLDDPLFPTRGVRARLGLFWSAPALGAELDFFEVTFTFAGHRKLGAGTVLSTGVRLATRNPLDGGPSLPVQQRLFLGGSESVRSFRQDQLSPTDAAGTPLGGLTALEFSIELRQRLTGNLYGAVFYDAGTVSADSWSAGDEAGQGVGAGLRYYLPIGPVRLDVAYNPGSLFAMTTRWAFHFAFGFSF